MPLPNFKGEDSWLAQSAARSLTKLRDQTQEQPLSSLEEEEERGERGNKETREQGEDSGRQKEDKLKDRSLERGFWKVSLCMMR